MSRTRVTYNLPTDITDWIEVLYEDALNDGHLDVTRTAIVIALLRRGLETTKDKPIEGVR